MIAALLTAFGNADVIGAIFLGVVLAIVTWLASLVSMDLPPPVTAARVRWN